MAYILPALSALCALGALVVGVLALAALSRHERHSGRRYTEMGARRDDGAAFEPMVRAISELARMQQHNHETLVSLLKDDRAYLEPRMQNIYAMQEQLLAGVVQLYNRTHTEEEPQDMNQVPELIRAVIDLLTAMNDRLNALGSASAEESALIFRGFETLTGELSAVVTRMDDIAPSLSGAAHEQSAYLEGLSPRGNPFMQKNACNAASSDVQDHGDALLLEAISAKLDALADISRDDTEMKSLHTKLDMLAGIPRDDADMQALFGKLDALSAMLEGREGGDDALQAQEEYIPRRVLDNKLDSLTEGLAAQREETAALCRRMDDIMTQLSSVHMDSHMEGLFNRLDALAGAQAGFTDTSYITQLRDALEERDNMLYERLDVIQQAVRESNDASGVYMWVSDMDRFADKLASMRRKLKKMLNDANEADRHMNAMRRSMRRGTRAQGDAAYDGGAATED